MLKPEPSPLGCFALAYNKADAKCQACPHAPNCRERMGFRLERIAIVEAKFALVPETIVRHHEEPEADRRDIQAIYCECYRQVYGLDAVGSVLAFRERLFRLVEAAQVDVRMFILISLFAYSKAYPAKTFTAKTLIDSRALYRVKVYADACKEHFGAVNPALLDVLTDGDVAVYDLNKRMLKSEVTAAKWIIKYKLWHQGPPYEPMFDDIENLLDPGWLAVEPRYEEIIKRYSIRQNQPGCPEKLATRHDAMVIYQRLKKHKHEAIAYFRARERNMNTAVGDVLAAFGYDGTDFEIENKPICDPLQFWNRMASAIQHMECLLFVNYQEGIYAKA